MAQEQIISRLRDIMARNAAAGGSIDWNAVGAKDSIASLGIDSLAMLDFIYDIQQEFGIEFDPQELVRIGTVGELADFIAQRSAA